MTNEDGDPKSAAGAADREKESTEGEKPKKKAGLGLMDLLMFLLGLILALVTTRACRP